jgi:SPP1 family predicted phage head-tail adaptor
MDIGKLRHRITIQTMVQQASPDPFTTMGAPSWSDVFTAWSRIEPIDSKAAYTQGVQDMQISHRVTIRYPGKNYVVAAGDQILFGTRVFSIVKGIMNEEEQNRQLVLLAWEQNPTQGGILV